MKNWQNEIDKTHTGQTGFFKTLEMEQNTNPQNFCIEDPVNVKSGAYNSSGIITNVDMNLQECKVHCMDEKFGWFKFSELTAMQDPEVETKCENCDGSGAIEHDVSCYTDITPQSEMRECDECNGSGEVYKCINEIVESIVEFTRA